MPMNLKQVQNRVSEILLILGDEDRRKKMGNGISQPVFEGRLENANRLLIAELKRLEKQEQFLSFARQANISLWIGIGSILVSLIATIMAVVIARGF